MDSRRGCTPCFDSPPFFFKLLEKEVPPCLLLEVVRLWMWSVHASVNVQMKGVILGYIQCTVVMKGKKLMEKNSFIIIYDVVKSFVWCCAYSPLCIT